MQAGEKCACVFPYVAASSALLQQRLCIIFWILKYISFNESHLERWRVRGTSHSWGYSTSHKRKNFHNENNWPLEYSRQGSGRFPNTGHLEDSAGQDVVQFCLWFFRYLPFWYSMILSKMMFHLSMSSISNKLSEAFFGLPAALTPVIQWLYCSVEEVHFLNQLFKAHGPSFIPK